MKKNIWIAIFAAAVSTNVLFANETTTEETTAQESVVPVSNDTTEKEEAPKSE